MKTWAKVAIGCLVVLLLLCCVSAVGGYFFWGKISSWWQSTVGGAMDTGKNIAAIQKLEQQYPFTEPADGTLSEARLQAFLNTCTQVKSAVAPHEAWLQAQRDGNGSATDAKKVMEVTSAISSALRQGLDAANMSPTEFRWIERTAYAALEEGTGTTGGEIQGQAGFEAMTQASLEVLESQKNDASLTEEQRQALQEQIDQLKSQMAPSPTGGEASPNAALAERYREQLQSADVRGVVEMGLAGSGNQQPSAGSGG